MLNNSGPRIDPCSTPNKVSIHELNWLFILTLCLRSVGNHSDLKIL